MESDVKVVNGGRRGHVACRIFMPAEKDTSRPMPLERFRTQVLGFRGAQLQFRREGHPELVPLDPFGSRDTPERARNDVINEVRRLVESRGPEHGVGAARFPADFPSANARAKWLSVTVLGVGDMALTGTFWH